MRTDPELPSYPPLLVVMWELAQHMEFSGNSVDNVSKALPWQCRCRMIKSVTCCRREERTLEQWESLLSVSGFSIRKIHPTISPHSIIEALKI